jgi:hypothetical protein
MDRCAVLQHQVDLLTCENTSTHWHSQAPDEPTRAPFATQSATHFDLVSRTGATKQAYSKTGSIAGQLNRNFTVTVSILSYCCKLFTTSRRRALGVEHDEQFFTDLVELLLGYATSVRHSPRAFSGPSPSQALLPGCPSRVA